MLRLKLDPISYILYLGLRLYSRVEKRETFCNFLKHHKGLQTPLINCCLSLSLDSIKFGFTVLLILKAY